MNQSVRSLMLTLSCLAVEPACMTGPSSDDDIKATSCGASEGNVGTINPFPAVDPNERRITGTGGGVTLSVGQTVQLGTCFFRDLKRPEERAAIAWSLADPGIANVSPSTGPTTTVTGLAYGKTKVRALITGVTVQVFAVVCDSTGCPPPPY